MCCFAFFRVDALQVDAEKVRVADEEHRHLIATTVSRKKLGLVSLIWSLVLIPSLLMPATPFIKCVALLLRLAPPLQLLRNQGAKIANWIYKKRLEAQEREKERKKAEKAKAKKKK